MYEFLKNPSETSHFHRYANLSDYTEHVIHKNPEEWRNSKWMIVSVVCCEMYFAIVDFQLIEPNVYVVCTP